MFIVSQISEDAIPGMPFFSTRNYSLDFARPVRLLDGKALTCTDKHWEAVNEQCADDTGGGDSPQTETAALLYWVTAKNYYPLGLIKGQPDHLALGGEKMVIADKLKNCDPTCSK